MSSRMPNGEFSIADGNAVLLDTNAIIWLVSEAPMAPDSVDTIRRAADAGQLLVSPISAWEIGLLAMSGGLEFRPTPQAWFAQMLEMPSVRLTPLTPEAAIDSAFLPGNFHRDPADRLLIATARRLAATIVTRDRQILAYAAEGHVGAIAC